MPYARCMKTGVGAVRFFFDHHRKTFVAAVALAALLVCACSAPPAASPWVSLAQRLREITPPGGIVLVYPSAGVVPLLDVLEPNVPHEKMIDAVGRFFDGQYGEEGDYAGYHWIVVPSVPGSTLEQRLTALAGSGRFTAVLSVEASDVARARFAVLDSFDAPGTGYGVRAYYRGDARQLASALDWSTVKSLADKYPPPPKHEPAPGDLLAARMALSLRYLTTGIDCDPGALEVRCIPHFDVDLRTTPPRQAHAAWDWCDISSRYALAALVLSDVVGPGNEAAPMRTLRNGILLSIARDGLAYRTNSTFSDVEADLFDQGSVLLYLIEQYRRTKEGTYRTLIENMVRALRRQLVATPHGGKYASPTVLPDGTPGIGANNWGGRADPCHHGGRLLYPLAQWLELAPDDADALALFHALAGYVTQDAGVFRADGSFGGHSHSRTNTLLGLLIRARATDDMATEALVRRSVDWLVATTPRWGWFPEFLPDGSQRDERNERAETDTLADMIALLLLLAEKDARYWDTVERYAANGLLQAQLTAGDGTGLFCGFCRPNAFGEATMNCCTPAGALALAAVRRAAVSRQGGTVHIALLFDRDDDMLTIKTAAAANERTVTIALKQGMHLTVRQPAGEAATVVEGRGTMADGRLDFGTLPAGARVQIRFAQPPGSEQFRVGGQSYTYTWAGNRVIAVSPQAARFAFWERGGER